LQVFCIVEDNRLSVEALFVNARRHTVRKE
jgi:hypothetical protein